MVARVLPAWVAASVTAALLSACTPGSSHLAPTSPSPPSSVAPSASAGQAPSAASDAVVTRRPFRLPKLRAGQPCPVTLARHRPDPALNVVQGLGPAGPVGLSARGALTYVGPDQTTLFIDKSWGGAKVLWAVDSSVDGAVLVRGGELGGPRAVRFGDPAAVELILAPQQPSHPGGWRDYPGFTRLTAPGCYAFQVDAPSSSTIIVFRAHGPSVR